MQRCVVEEEEEGEEENSVPFFFVKFKSNSCLLHRICCISSRHITRPSWVILFVQITDCVRDCRMLLLTQRPLRQTINSARQLCTFSFSTFRRLVSVDNHRRLQCFNRFSAVANDRSCVCSSYGSIANWSKNTAGSHCESSTSSRLLLLLPPNLETLLSRVITVAALSRCGSSCSPSLHDRHFLLSSSPHQPSLGNRPRRCCVPGAAMHGDAADSSLTGDSEAAKDSSADKKQVDEEEELRNQCAAQQPQTNSACSQAIPPNGGDGTEGVCCILGGAVASSPLTAEQKHEQALLVGEECVTSEELLNLFRHKANPICYDGFEPSGRMHIAQGVLKAINVNRLTSTGCVFVFWVADWFALLNNKMGGDLNKIKKVGQYFIEVWKAVGMDMQNVRFLWSSDEINKDPSGYWLRVMDIARKFTITRVKRCCQIMGRKEGDDQPAAQILYPCMQCADIFFLKADICQLGIDQRKVNALAREYAELKKMRKHEKPIILSHKLLPGLLEGQEKMSKSDPDSAIFMEDNEAEVNRKIKKAFCPPEQTEGNPVLAYAVALILPKFGVMEINTRGGMVRVETAEMLYSAYASGQVHPSDLKPVVAQYINQLIEPVRKHFEMNEEAKKLLKEIKSYKTG